MKESDITQPVIDKCKQIAELWRMEIYRGCWYRNSRDCESHCWGGSFSIPAEELEFNLQGMLPKDKPKALKITPIPSISDCLEKLGERNEWMPDYYNKKDFNRSLLNIFKNYIEGKFTTTEVHYWLLSALLGVLRDAESWDYRLFHPHDAEEK